MGPILIGVGLALAVGAGTGSWVVGVVVGMLGLFAFRAARARTPQKP